MKVIMKKIFKFMSIMFLIFTLLGIGAITYLGYTYYPEYEALKKEAKLTLEQTNTNTFKRLEPTQIIRPNGEVVREFAPLQYEYIEFDNIPSYVKQAFISIEDKRFYVHDGVDYKAIMRASLELIKNKGKITQGGSTITQQLVKLTFLTNEQSYKRKINEIFISWELERTLSKDKILEYYINNIYFGNRAYGFETAANHYFSKTSNELSLAEITFLAAIPNNPTIFDPINNKENTIKRQRLILQNMLSDEKISEEVYNNAVNEVIELNILEREKYVPEDFEISFVLHSTIEILMENDGFNLQYNLSNEQRKLYEQEYNKKYLELNEQIRQGGYTIVSTIDPQKQALLQKTINQGLQKFTAVDEQGLYQTQGAGVVINNQTYEVEAIIGGRTAENQVNTFNRAMLSYRQPGSIMKPIAAYGVEADIELLGFHKYQDVKDPKGPKNVNNKYKGSVTAREALERSINTIPFELVKNRGPKLVHQYLHKMRFSKLVEEDLNAGIAIGGFTYGVTPFEIAGAFSTFANNGKYVRPLGVSEIKFNNEIVFTNLKEGVQVYKSNSAYLMTDMMKGVLTSPSGTGRNMKLSSMPAAAKTGTTDNNKDGWFAGYTPYYTTVIWVGNDVPKKVNNLFGSTFPGQIWKSFMEEIHKGLETKDFDVPLGIETIYISYNGKIYDYYKKGWTKEILTSHLSDSINVFDKNGVGRLDRKAEEERIKQMELEREIKKEEFFNKYGVTLESEETTISTIEQSIRNVMSLRITNSEELSYVINKLNELRYEIEDLYDLGNQTYLINKINESKELANIKFDKYLESLIIKENDDNKTEDIEDNTDTEDTEVDNIENDNPQDNDSNNDN